MVDRTFRLRLIRHVIIRSVLSWYGLRNAWALYSAYFSTFNFVFQVNVFLIVILGLCASGQSYAGDSLQWGIEDAKIPAPSAINSQLLELLSFRDGTGSEYSRACFACCREFCLCLPFFIICWILLQYRASCNGQWTKLTCNFDFRPNTTFADDLVINTKNEKDSYFVFQVIIRSLLGLWFVFLGHY